MKSSKFKVQGSKSAAERPFVFINCAISADGKLAPATRRYAPFGSARDAEMLYALRATADAIVCGARTIEQSATLLGNGPERFTRRRLRRGLSKHNLRVIVSGSGSVAPASRIFQHRFSPLLVLTTERAGKKRLQRLRQLADRVQICGENEIDFAGALAWLRREWGVKRLLCEGGGELNASLLLAGLVDEVFVTVCPLVIGGRRAPTLADGLGVPRLAEAVELELRSAKRVGDEMFLRYRVCAGEAGRHAGVSPAGRIGLFTTESWVWEEAARPNPKARPRLNRPV
ncbi:MAG: dihydrofolate reductase family protein, partial [Verrucomicrobia bacterium]|nr:dihydrofolate reductase family protein [Verrucomicrobiota bacterium]